MIDTILSRNPAIALGLCGFVSAIANILITMANIEILIYAFGVAFGAILAGYLVVAKNLSWPRAGAIVITFGVSWIAAFYFALVLYDSLNDVTGGIAILSMLAGGLGAIIVAIGFSVAYPKYRSLKHVAITVIVGALAGLALMVDLAKADSEFMEFVWIIWQTTVGASLGWDRKVFE